jgi:hypothetical protein
MMRNLLLWLPLCILVACAAPPPVTTACPALRHWSDADQDRARQDLKLLPADSPIRTMLLDYKRMRKR